MFGKKTDFKPDRTESGTLSKLYLTKKQRRSVLKWLLYALILVVLSLVQDVIMSRVSIGGATTDLVVGAILLLCLMLDVERGAVFILISSLLYCLSGTAPGIYSLAFLTGIGVFFSIFRHSYLREGFWSTLLTAAVCLLLYQILVFLVGIFLERTIWPRIGIFLLSGLLTLATLPILYPIFNAIEKIGGDAWKD